MKSVTRIIWSVISLAFALIPTWIFFIIKSLTNPEGFWQTAVIYGFGAYFLFGIQFILLMLWIGFLGKVIFD